MQRNVIEDYKVNAGFMYSSFVCRHMLFNKEILNYIKIAATGDLLGTNINLYN